MRKKMIVLLILGLAVLLMPQSASAEWYDNGIALEPGENPVVEMTGTVTFIGPTFGVHCPAGTISVRATGGTTTGHLVAYEAENTKTCEVSGGLVFLSGGTTSVKAAQLTSVPTADHNGKVIELLNINWHIEFNSGFKLTLSTPPECTITEKIEGITTTTTVTTPITVTPDDLTAATGGTAEGTLNNNLSASPVVVQASGNILGEASGTYGLVS